MGVKKILIIIALQFLLFLSVGLDHPKAAGSCSCNMDSRLSLVVVSDSCSNDSVATCTSNGSSSLVGRTIGCNCVVSNPGTNCVTQGIPPLGQSCCAGYHQETRSGACISDSVTNPYDASQQKDPAKPIIFSTSNSSSDVLCEGNGIKTAIGCIPVLGDSSGKEFMTFVLRWAVGVGGGIAFLLILYAGFMTMTSAGNPERLKAGQELLTSAISGLILLILSVFVLNFIGINILGIFT